MNQAEISVSEEVLNRLSLLLQGGRFPHALILEGGAGQEKTEAALFLARAAVCTGENKPCGHCPGCRKALASSHPDIYVAGGGAAARSFHVEAIRFIRSDAYIKPNEAPRKVYVLLEAQTMSEQAQNALLKILEEPPENVLFLLTVPSASALLATVRSRSQLLTLAAPQQTHADDALVNAVVDGLCAPGDCERVLRHGPADPRQRNPAPAAGRFDPAFPRCQHSPCGRAGLPFRAAGGSRPVGFFLFQGQAYSPAGNHTGCRPLAESERQRGPAGNGTLFQAASGSGKINGPGPPPLTGAASARIHSKIKPPGQRSAPVSRIETNPAHSAGRV